MLAKSAVFFLFLCFSFPVLSEETVNSNTFLKEMGCILKKIFLNLLLEKSLVLLDENY